MLNLNGKKIQGQSGKHLSLVIILYLCSALPSQVNGAKGPLKVPIKKFDGGAFQMYMDFHGIQYRKSPEVLDDPTASFYYFRTDKTWDEIYQATVDFQTKLYRPGFKNAGPILRKLGYKLKYKDDLILFSTKEELNRLQGSGISFGGRNQEAYDLLKQKGFKVGYAIEPAPGTLFFKNPQEKERAIDIAQMHLG